MLELGLAGVGDARGVDEDAARHAPDQEALRPRGTAVAALVLVLGERGEAALADARGRDALGVHGDVEVVHAPGAGVEVDPAAVVPVARGQRGLARAGFLVGGAEEVGEGGGEDGGDLLGVEAGDHGLVDGGRVGGAVRVQEGDAGAHGELGLREAAGQAAEGLDAEGPGDLGVVHGQADFFPGFAAGDLI